MDLLLFGFLSLGSLWYFIRLARTAEAGGPRVAFQIFQSPDAIFAALLGLWFIFLTYLSLSQTKAMVVDTSVLITLTVVSFTYVTSILAILFVRSMNPLTVFGLRNFSWSMALRSLLAIVIAFPVIYFTYALAVLFSGPEASPQPLVQFFTAPSTALYDRILVALTAIVVAPLTEELVFRGYFYGVLRRFGGRWPALILSATLFAAIHAHIPSLLPLLILAVALTLVYEQTGSLWAPILMHACFNTTTIALAILWPNLGS